MLTITLELRSASEPPEPDSGPYILVFDDGSWIQGDYAKCIDRRASTPMHTEVRLAWVDQYGEAVYDIEWYARLDLSQLGVLGEEAP